MAAFGSATVTVKLLTSQRVCCVNKHWVQAGANAKGFAAWCLPPAAWIREHLGSSMARAGSTSLVSGGSHFCLARWLQLGSRRFPVFAPQWISIKTGSSLERMCTVIARTPVPVDPHTQRPASSRDHERQPRDTPSKRSPARGAPRGMRSHGRLLGCPRAPGPRDRRQCLEGTAFTWTIHTLHRVELYIEPWNSSSIRVAGASGFHGEGLLRSHQEMGGTRRNMLIYATTRP